MITCRVIDPNNNYPTANFFNNNNQWSYEYISREHEDKMSKPIQRFRCKDKKNNINFYFLEFWSSYCTKKYYVFKNNEDRTKFLLTYF